MKERAAHDVSSVVSPHSHFLTEVCAAIEARSCASRPLYGRSPEYFLLEILSGVGEADHCRALAVNLGAEDTDERAHHFYITKEVFPLVTVVEHTDVGSVGWAVRLVTAITGVADCVLTAVRGG